MGGLIAWAVVAIRWSDDTIVLKRDASADV